jgi:deoxyribodipyrimidine photolyase
MAQKFVLVILHRELRVDDNSAISVACKIAKDVGCKVKIVFKFDDRQISPAKNKYFGANGFIFMLECLSALTDFVHILDVNESFGKPIAIVTTADYTPFAVKRLDEYKKIGVPVIVTTQHIVSHPDLIRTNAGKVFEMNFAQLLMLRRKK